MATTEALMASGLASKLSQILGMEFASGLAGTGSSQAGALALTADINYFSTVNASTGALLPPAFEQNIIAIYNGGSNPLTVYPSGSELVNNTTSFSVTNGKAAIFVGSGKDWIAVLSA